MLSAEAINNITQQIGDKVITGVITDDRFQHIMCELLDTYIEKEMGSMDENHKSEIAMLIYQQFEAAMVAKADYTIDINLTE